MQHCPKCQSQPYARLGGLFSCGPDQDAMWLRAVGMAAEAMRGKPVGEIPFDQPTRIGLTLNRETASITCLTLSRELLLRADEVIG